MLSFLVHLFLDFVSLTSFRASATALHPSESLCLSVLSEFFSAIISFIHASGCDTDSTLEPMHLDYVDNLYDAASGTISPSGSEIVWGLVLLTIVFARPSLCVLLEL